MIDLVHNVAYVTNGKKTEKVAVPAADAGKVDDLRMELLEAASVSDEELMEKFLEEMDLSEEEAVKGIRLGVLSRDFIPVFAGAALSGIGTEALMQAIVDYVPTPADEECKPDAPVAAFVFKTISDQFGKYSFIKVMAGKVTSDLSLRNMRAGSTDKLGRMYTMCGKKNTEVKEACCGDIVAIGKMDWKTGDTVCDPKNEVEFPAIEIAEPVYSMAISPKTKGQDDKVASGLARLNEEDISFNLVNNAETHQMVISGAGDIQVDVLCSKLKSRFGVETELKPARVAYREKIRGPRPPQEAVRRQRPVRRRVDPLRAPGRDRRSDLRRGSVRRLRAEELLPLRREGSAQRGAEGRPRGLSAGRPEGHPV